VLFVKKYVFKSHKVRAWSILVVDILYVEAIQI
jgi:hypothetical protein